MYRALNERNKRFRVLLKKRKDKFDYFCGDNINEYFENTTIQALKYIGNRHSSIFGRLIFAIICVVVVILTAKMIRDVGFTWLKRPMTITWNPEIVSIKDIPFPSVTVCNNNRVKKSAMENLTKSDFYLANKICKGTIDITENDIKTEPTAWPDFKKILLKVRSTVYVAQNSIIIYVLNFFLVCR